MDPGLENTGICIFDEFHERSLHAALGLALWLKLKNTYVQDYTKKTMNVPVLVSTNILLYKNPHTLIILLLFLLPISGCLSNPDNSTQNQLFDFIIPRDASSNNSLYFIFRSTMGTGKRIYTILQLR